MSDYKLTPSDRELREVYNKLGKVIKELEEIESTLLQHVFLFDHEVEIIED